MILAAAALTLTLADLRKTVSLASPQISPDARRVALIVRRNDYEKDKTHADVVLVNVRTHGIRTLLHDVSNLGEIEWSPDGSRLAYTAQGPPEKPDEPGVSQIFVLPMSGGEPVQITHDKVGVNSFDWRPDSRALAYGANIEPPNQKAIKAHEDGFEVTDNAWTDQSDPTQEQLYEIRSSGGTAKRIGNGDWSLGGGYTYAGNGRSIFVTRTTDHRHPNRFLSREIVRIDVASGRAMPIPALSQTQFGPERGPGGRMAFGFANPKGAMQSELALADANGDHPHSVTVRLDRNIGSYNFMPDGSLVVAASDATQRRLFRLTPVGNVSVLPLGLLSAGFVDVSRNGTVAFTASSPTHPAELYVLPPASRTPIRLTNYNGWIARYRLGTTRTITWRTFDGMTADGVLTAPSSTKNKRAPLVLYIHGGPTGTSTTAYSGFVQVMAAHGWYVFQPNYRGSDNLGLRFARTTVPHITSVPGRDIEAGLQAVLRSTPIDQERIGVSGWSEGGLMTSWLITQDRRWRAAVSGAAVNDWVQYDTMTDSKDFTPLFIGRSPWSSAAQNKLFEAESPLSYASNVKTPTLIMSDAGDFRVPTPLAYEFYHEVRATGTPVQLVVYPVVGHFPRDPVRVEDIYRRWEAWFVRYLGS